MAEAETHSVVIVGGGICGLATALALHRKGIASLVLEKSRSLRAFGAGIGVHENGWRVLEQLGVAAELRETARLITTYNDVWQQGDKISRDKYPVRTELRCLNRKDLIEALAKDIPAGTIRFGCRIAAIDEDPAGGPGAVLTTVDGTTMKAKVLIGCEGIYSVVAKYLGLSPVRTIPRPIFRGFTSYPHGHQFENEFLRLRVGDFFIGRLTITDKLVHFFIAMPKRPPTDVDTKDMKAVRGVALKEMKEVGCPAEIMDIVRDSDLESLNFVTEIWYRLPWEAVFGTFQKGTVTVAGDAMHAMGPFIGQGGSAGLEDAIVLARSLARAVDVDDDGAEKDAPAREKMIGDAIGEYIRERRPRVALLSLESFITGVLLVRLPSPVIKLACVAVLILLGSKSLRHAKYDCGRL